jgi:hypothetical protein
MDIAEIVTLAGNEGRPGLNGWIGERAELFCKDSHVVESLFSSLMEASIGAALWFAVVPRAKGFLTPAVTLELERVEAANRHLWVTGVCHIMMPHIAEKVRLAWEGRSLVRVALLPLRRWFSRFGVIRFN